MDRKIDRKWYQKRQIWWSGGGVLVVLVLITLVLTTDSQSRLNVETERITISTVERGPFQVYIPLTGTVMPIRTVYLDAMEGGRVEAVLKEAGSFVNKGDTILHLSNASLLLDIMNREAQLFEQSNNLRNTRLAMQQNALNLEGELLDLKRQLQTSERAFLQNQKLYEKQLISQDQFNDSRDQYEYVRRRQELTLESQKQDSMFRSLQIESLEASVTRIQTNLGIVRQNFENLYLRAPVSGQLTSLNAEIGESKMRGERLGQVDILDGFKVRAGVDEHYITRVQIGLKGEFDLADKTYELEIIRVYPEVRDGRFEVDLEFLGEVPQDIRRGQTAHVRLELSDVTECMLLPRGGFYQSTGGRWAYVLDESGEYAIKREIRLGQQNPRMFEVLEGLQPGDRVVTSSYENFGDVDKLVLNN
ncbi:MAG: HlyD family efflux transporter periplasmic adaptor subunit [candidate division Zixibacteria bacterium]|nr:HlyD family efflux transporter periplasmic adaptor subunit [candidate division Zixibacteria bacterium]